MDCNLPGSSGHGILQARILEWVAMPSSRRSSLPRNQTWVSYVSNSGRQVLYHEHRLGNPTCTRIALTDTTLLTRMWRSWKIHPYCWECKMGQLESILAVPQMVNLEWPCESKIPPLNMQRVRHKWATELNWNMCLKGSKYISTQKHVHNYL